MTRRVVTSLLLLYSGLIIFAEGVLNAQPTLDHTAVNVTVVEGRTAILPCTVHNLGRHKVVWSDQWQTVLTFNEKRVIDDIRISVQRDRNEEWNLRFDRVKYGDQGTYECQINTTPSLTQPVSLYVVVPPRITSEDPRKIITVREGDRATLSCNASGTPVPSVTWHKQPDIPGMTRERIGHTGEILVIHNVTRHCGGKYECVADNGVPPRARRTIEVRVKYPPEVHVANRRLGQSIGKDTVLECVVAGYPQAVSAWHFKGKKLSNTEKYKVDIYNHQERLDSLTISLIVKNIDVKDYGQYTCAASNDVGKANDKMNLYQYHQRTKAPSTTPTTTTTTTLGRHVIEADFLTNGPNGVYVPKGRKGIGHNLKNAIRANDRSSNDYNNPQTRPAVSSWRGRNGSEQPRTNFIFTVISLAFVVCFLSLV